MHERVLDEGVLGQRGLEGLFRDEVVVLAIDLAGAGAARRVGHREAEGVGERRQQPRDQRALSDARRAGDDDGAEVRLGDGARRGGLLQGREVVQAEGDQVLRVLQADFGYEIVQQALQGRVRLDELPVLWRDVERVVAAFVLHVRGTFHVGVQ